MSKSLVIVESPTKSKTIKKYLGKDFEVDATVGHIKDLPKQRLGIDVDHNFRPEYIMILGKRKIVEELKKKATQVDTILIATDPDREGEAIGWHVANELVTINPKVQRVLFNEITRTAVTKAITEAREIDLNRVDAQQARRVLDRLVGYKISPVLWQKVRKGLSAGRVQSVALRLLVDREREILAFTSQEYWTFTAVLLTGEQAELKAKLHKIKGKKVEVSTAQQAQGLLETIKQATFVVENLDERVSFRQPAAPFITSTLQQEASRKHKFNAQKTMMIAQALYEGKELGEHESTGLITYMRTDSPRVSQESIAAVREFIGSEYGPEFLPAKPNVYKSKKSAQEAHEAIRPTDMRLTPAVVAPHLGKDELALYTLIWKRFIASQMNPQQLSITTITIANDDREFQARGSRILFNGFAQVYSESHDEGDESDDDLAKLPKVSKGEVLQVRTVDAVQNFTKPPARYTEATLVKELEESGIGRPSTYATILQIIRNRNYATFENRRYQPTELGIIVVDLLVQGFNRLMSVEFTAEMEKELDAIEEGRLNWVTLVANFYEQLKVRLAEATASLPNIKAQVEQTDLICEKCGSAMVIKWGVNGKFLACSGFPNCRNTMEYRRDENGKVEPAQQVVSERTCPLCGSPLIQRSGKFGRFYACSKYPECKHSQPYGLGIPCPQPGCDGEIVEVYGKRGRLFYGCSHYPQCELRLWSKPVSRACPVCGYGVTIMVRTKKRELVLKCPQKGCSFTEAIEEHEE